MVQNGEPFTHDAESNLLITEIMVLRTIYGPKTKQPLDKTI